MKTPKSRDDGSEEEKENSLRGFVLPRKSRQEHAKKTYRTGRWSNEERLLFLKGMRRFGAGQWKEIGLYVTSRYVESKRSIVHARNSSLLCSATLSCNFSWHICRSISQIKSHGQTAVRQINAGEAGIFQELIIAEANGVAPQSPANLLEVVSDTTKRRMLMDPATLATAAPATTNSVITSVMAVQEDRSGCAAPESSLTGTPPCAALLTTNLPRSLNELIAAEALCALLKTTTSYHHGEVVTTKTSRDCC